MVAILRTSRGRRVIAPCDPTCPDVITFLSGLLNDPMTKAMGAPVDDITEAWEAKHLKTCLRCQEYSVENIDIE